MTMFVNNEEMWAKCPIEGYEHYEVSTFGRVRNTKKKSKKILKAWKVDCYDYRKYDLHSGGKRKKVLVHRLVWMTFRGEIPLTMQVDHVDNNPANNRLDNLQLLTPSENTRKRVGGWKRGEGKWSTKIKPKRKVSDETSQKLRVGIKAYHDARKAALMEP